MKKVRIICDNYKSERLESEFRKEGIKYSMQQESSTLTKFTVECAIKDIAKLAQTCRRAFAYFANANLN